MTSMDVTVRLATAADADGLAEVGGRSFRAAYADSSSAEDLASHIDTHFRGAAIRAELERDDTAYLIALCDGQPAGFAKLMWRAAPERIPFPNVVGLAQLYIAPDFQRNGVGSRLINKVEQVASDRGCAGIWLSVWQNAHWAIRFYERHRFRTVGTIPFTVGRSDYTDYLMWLPIDDFSPAQEGRGRKN
jgi:GNAT superfamily N-acetyltransferase